ncbi:MAG: hypothetical protein NVSMB30_30290 [Hymenobacter sp.]
MTADFAVPTALAAASPPLPVAGEQPEVNTLFPVFLKLETMRVLLVGGGNVALEKLAAILHLFLFAADSRVWAGSGQGSSCTGYYDEAHGQPLPE